MKIGTDFVGKRFARKEEFVSPSTTYVREMWTISDGYVDNANPGVFLNNWYLEPEW